MIASVEKEGRVLQKAYDLLGDFEEKQHNTKKKTPTNNIGKD